MSFLNYLQNRVTPIAKTSDLVAQAQIRSEEPIKILLSGEINAGKSSLVNAILGAPLLPAEITGHTAAIHFCRNGEVPRFTVRFRDQNREPYSGELKPGTLKTYLNEGGATVELIEIEHPAIPLGITLIDTPGINDEDPYRDKLVRAFMADADCLVFIFDITRAATRTEVDFLRQYVGKFRLKHCLFLGNKIDLISAADRKAESTKLWKTLCTHIASGIAEGQVLTVTTRNECDAGTSLQEFTKALASLLQKQGRILSDRINKKRLFQISSEVEVLRARIEKSRGQNPDLVVWTYRARTIGQNGSHLKAIRDQIFTETETLLKSELEKATEVLVAESDLFLGKDGFQARAEAEVAGALEAVKAHIAMQVSKAPDLSVSIENTGGIWTQKSAGREQVNQDHHLGQSKANLLTQAVLYGLPMALGLPGFVSIGIAAFGLWSSYKSNNDLVSDTQKVKKQLRDDLAKHLAEVREQTLQTLTQWYDDQIRAQEKAAVDFLKELYAAFNPLAHDELRPAEAQLKILESEFEKIRTEIEAA